MSEKLYAWLLRLYPSHFRETYGDESLQLFRDRARDEKGFLPRLRLWLDLLLDATISLPREYLHIPSARVVASGPQHLNGIPTFYVLQNASPRPGALFVGGLLSLVTLATCWASLGHYKNPANSQATEFGYAPGESRFAETRPAPPNPPSAASAAPRPFTQPDALNKTERKRVFEEAIANLKAHYIDKDAAQKMADTLLAHEKHGDNDAAMDPATFAALLTQQTREVKPDRHLTLDYSQSPLPQQPLGRSPEVLAHYRQEMKKQNCAFEKVEILPRNIGYLKLNSFPDPDICRIPAMAAMTYVNHADAIIFDLRDNRGGDPAMVQFLAAYLFDHPEYWYNPRENTTERSWTLSPVPGNDLADKPVYVLTSPATFSGAEQFCYDLKMLKRATLIGETTGGGAHAGVWHRIDDHFGIGIPETKAINPYSTGDWAEVGVEPDVKVNPADAYETALKLARNKLKKN